MIKGSYVWVTILHCYYICQLLLHINQLLPYSDITKPTVTEKTHTINYSRVVYKFGLLRSVLYCAMLAIFMLALRLQQAPASRSPSSVGVKYQELGYDRQEASLIRTTVASFISGLVVYLGRDQGLSYLHLGSVFSGCSRPASASCKISARTMKTDTHWRRGRPVKLLLRRSFFFFLLVCLPIWLSHCRDQHVRPSCSF